MKVSILIAAHQNGTQIAEALASVRSQFHTDWELLVVEHGPADGTSAIVRDFAAMARQTVHYLGLGDSHGAASARNRGLELATAELVAFLDASDRWTPAHLATAIEHLAGDVDIVASNVTVFDPENGQPVSDVPVRAQLTANPVRTLFVRNELAVPSAVAFRREVVRRAGPFDTRFRAQETRDFWLRCALTGARFGATHRATCRCAKTASRNPARTALLVEQAAQFYEKHRDVVGVPAALRRQLLSASLVQQGQLLRTSDPSRAARCFWRAWSLQPVEVQTLGHFALTGWRNAAAAPPATPAAANTAAPAPDVAPSPQTRSA